MQPGLLPMTLFSGFVLALFQSHLASQARAADSEIKLGIIGLDSSHAVEFTRSINATPAHPGLEGLRVVAAVPAGSPDLPASADRIEGFTQKVQDLGVRIVDDIDTLLSQVDGVIINSVDGRVHLEQAKAVIASGKPVFIDKPLANSWQDGREIFELARKRGVPCFSSSALRFSPEVAGVNQIPDLGSISGCSLYSPAHSQLHHPELFYYGIHGVEPLLTVMGPGCVSVSCTRTPDADVVVGTWKDGRIGTYRALRKGKTGYGMTVFGSQKIVSQTISVSYEPLLVEISRFFKSGQPPIPPEVTLEILAFMQAANESHKRNGAVVQLSEITTTSQP